MSTAADSEVERFSAGLETCQPLLANDSDVVAPVVVYYYHGMRRRLNGLVARSDRRANGAA